MSNWALIVGIDVYQLDAFRLSGAVNDALTFLDWCVNGGGGVPAANVNLLLDAQPEKVDPARLPPGVAYQSATRDAFSESVTDLLKRSNSNGDRFFFYFAGHGITARVNGADIPCICLRNFTPTLTVNAVTLPSVFARLNATQFKEQYFFIDACRNIPFSSEFQVADFDRPAIAMGTPGPQFIAYATQPRNTAAELLAPGFEGGAFTQTLLAGLRGQGAAKQWDGENGQYVVSWNSLFRFVEQGVLAMKLRSQVPGKSGVIQSPRQYGERGSENPVLATLAENLFGLQKLQVTLTPVEASADVSLTVSDIGAAVFKQFPAPLSSKPWEIELPPRLYGVRATGTQYRSKQPMSKVDLYDTYPLVIEMVNAPPQPVVPLAPAQAPSPGVQSRGIFEDGEAPRRGLGPHGGDFEAVEESLRPDTGGDVRPASAPSGAAGLDEALPEGITADDSLAQLEIADEAGRVLAVGRGQAYLPASAGDGLFRARLIHPDGAFDETLVAMSSRGGAPPALIASPALQMTPGMIWATQHAHIQPSENGLLMPSEAIGSAAFLKLSTLLALAAGARVEGSGPGAKLRNIPLPLTALPETFAVNTGGIQIVLGDELLAADWRRSSISVAAIATPDNKAPLEIKFAPDAPSVAGADAVVPLGSYWLSLTSADNSVAGELTVSVLPGRIALLVLTREADHSLDLHQYSLWLPSTVQQDLKYLDPQYQGARFAAIRRIELMQRTYVHGRTSPLEPDIRDLLYDKWIDPVAGCLGGYMLLRMGRARELEVPSRNLSSHFDGLSDSWVLRAAYFEAVGNQAEARAATVNALDRGVPVFAPGVRKLADLAVVWATDHPRKGLLAELARTCFEGGIFSVFLPKSVASGVGQDSSTVLAAAAH